MINGKIFTVEFPVSFVEEKFAKVAIIEGQDDDWPCVIYPYKLDFDSKEKIEQMALKLFYEGKANVVGTHESTMH